MDIADRVRAHTAISTNLRIAQQIAERMRTCADATDEELTRRIDALDREWDIERFLETNASLLALTGLVLGLTRDRRWFALPAADGLTIRSGQRPVAHTGWWQALRVPRWTKTSCG